MWKKTSGTANNFFFQSYPEFLMLVWNIKFDELDFLSISNLSFTGYSRQKNQVQTGKKFKLIKQVWILMGLFRKSWFNFGAKAYLFVGKMTIGTIHLRRRHFLGGRGQKLVKFADG
jgi:hypothetical protein